jgi:LAO/AO transport system kinase
MLVATPRAGGAPRPERPRPKQPEVLITTAATGAGVPELLAALDRHRAAGHDGATPAARLVRAEAQVWAILADRLRGSLREQPRVTTTNETLAAVADHTLDPYAAADRLLASILRKQPS